MKETIHVWSFFIEDFSNRVYLDIYDLIKNDLPQHISSSLNSEMRIRKIIGVLLLQKATSEYGQKNISIKNIKRTKKNKPFLSNWYNFNLSYSQQFVVLSFSKNIQIGIDIELVQNIDYLPIIKYFHEDERTRILTSNQQQISFYDTWVRKEAFLKAQGLGITEELSAFDTYSMPLISNNIEWFLKDIDLHPSYICYLACDSKEVNILSKRLSFVELLVT